MLHSKTSQYPLFKSHPQALTLCVKATLLSPLRFLWPVCLAANYLIAGNLQGAEARAKRPNIVLILADDLGYSDLGCYGGEIQTPNLDKLAANGLRFTQFYNTARCWPSRAALLTGYYAQQVNRDALPGFNGGGKGVRPHWAPLLPVLLADQGYRSYHSGKWHIDGRPLDNGFSHSFEVGAKAESNYFKAEGNKVDNQPSVQTDDYYVTSVVAEHAVSCLREHAQKHGDTPFFQYIAFTAPHFPLQAPESDIAKYRDKYLKGWNAVASERHHRMTEMGITHHPLPEMEREVGPPYAFPEQLSLLGPNEVNRPIPWRELTPEQRQFQSDKMAVHAALVDRMDQEIGRIIAQLKAMDAFENTLILFLSDNGASAEMMVRGDGHDPAAPPGSKASFLCLGPGWSSAANTPFRRHKTWVHEGGISTPLIVHWPKGLQARGELRHHPGHLIDVVPTLLQLSEGRKPLEIGGVQVPPAPGHSLVDILHKDAPILDGHLWWLHEKNRAIRSGDWKLVALAGSEWELYDLSKDRGESTNLASSHPDKVKELMQIWDTDLEQTVKLVKGARN